jgi:hypothetical protein
MFRSAFRNTKKSLRVLIGETLKPMLIENLKGNYYFWNDKKNQEQKVLLPLEGYNNIFHVLLEIFVFERMCDNINVMQR